MLERTSARAGEDCALKNAVVIQRVVKNQVARLEQVPDNRFVGRVTAEHDNGVVGSDKFGNLAFQVNVNRFLTGNESAGGNAGAVFRDSVLNRFDDFRIAGGADVVVAGEADVLFAVDVGFIVDNSLMNGEVRVSHAGCVLNLKTLLELFDFRPLADVPGGFRNLVQVRMDALARAGTHVLFNRLNDVVGGDEVLEFLFREPSAEGLFQTGENFHSFQRIQADFGNRGFHGEVLGTLASNRLDLHENDFRNAFCIVGVNLSGDVFLLLNQRVFFNRFWNRFADSGRGRRRGFGRFRAFRPRIVRSLFCNFGSLLRNLHSQPVDGGVPAVEFRQRSVQIFLTAGVTLNLAAGRLGNASLFHQNDNVDWQFVFVGNCLANGSEEFFVRRFVTPFDFLKENKAFFAVFVDDEQRAFVTKFRMAVSAGRFNVLRINIDAVKNNEVFQTSGNEQFAVVQKAEVAGSHIGLVVRVRRLSLEDFLGQFRFVEITLSARRAFDPDFADFVLLASHVRVRIDDKNRFVHKALTASDERSAVFSAAFNFDGFALTEFVNVERADYRGFVNETACYNKRRFRQSETRIEGFASESAGSELFAEGVDRFRLDGFRAVKCDFPAAQVQLFHFVRLDFANAVIVSEVWTAAGGRAESADSGKPSEWTL